MPKIKIKPKIKKDEWELVEEFQTGGRTPIITNDRERYNRYQDSLNLYNFGQEGHRDLLRARNIEEWENMVDNRSSSFPNTTHFISHSSQENRLLPGSSLPSTNVLYPRPVQPVIYRPEQPNYQPTNIIENGFRRMEDRNGTFDAVWERIKDKPISIQQSKPDLFQTLSLANQDIETIPFQKNSYFTRPRQSQESSNNQFGRIGKTDYFDKKTGKLLGTYAQGGNINEMGYRDDSKFKNRPFIDIHTKNGIIDMSETGIPLMAEGKYLPPYSGLHKFNSKVVREIPLRQDGGKVEDKIDKYLGNPQGKAWKFSQPEEGFEDDGIDNLRHTGAGRYTAEAIMKKTGNIPVVSNYLGFLGSNILGAGHELLNPNRGGTLYETIREGAEDIYNNFVGSAIGALPFKSKTKDNILKKLSYNNYLPDGYGQKGVNMYFKQDGGKIKQDYAWSNQQQPTGSSGKGVTNTENVNTTYSRRPVPGMGNPFYKSPEPQPLATGRADYVPVESLLLPATPAIRALGKVGNIALDAVNPFSGFGKPNLENLGNILPRAGKPLNTRILPIKDNPSYPYKVWNSPEVMPPNWKPMDFKNERWYEDIPNENIDGKNLLTGMDNYEDMLARKATPKFVNPEDRMISELTAPASFGNRPILNRNSLITNEKELDYFYRHEGDLSDNPIFDLRNDRIGEGMTYQGKDISSPRIEFNNKELAKLARNSTFNDINSGSMPRFMNYSDKLQKELEKYNPTLFKEQMDFQKNNPDYMKKLELKGKKYKGSEAYQTVGHNKFGGKIKSKNDNSEWELLPD